MTKINSYAFSAAQQLRTEAREFRDTLYPHAQVDLRLHSQADHVAIAALIRETQPHPRDEVISALGQLGVQVS